MLQGLRAPRGADLGEPIPKAQPLPHRPHPRRSFSRQCADVDTFASAHTVPYTTKPQVSKLTTPTNLSNPPNSGLRLKVSIPGALCCRKYGNSVG